MNDKVEKITGVIGDPRSWRVVEPVGEMVLVDVPGRPGARQRMHKSEAIRLGLWKAPDADALDTTQKARPAKSNKARRPGANKGA